jgi:hypothetical protein
MAEQPDGAPARNVTPQDHARRTGAKDEAGAPRRIEVRPEDVLQPDRRPWRRLSLDGVVVRLIALSALVVAVLLGIMAGVGRLLGLW